MSNFFNNYFTSIAEKTKSNIRFSPKHYADYLSSTYTNTFFLTPTAKNEISFRISSLNPHKSSGPNSIQVKILKLLKNDISQQSADIFNPLSVNFTKWSNTLKQFVGCCRRIV